MVCSFPDSPFILRRRFPICAGQLIYAVELGIDLVLLDEAPLSIGAVRRGLTFIAEAPVESAVLFVLHYVAHVVHAPVNDSQKLLL